MNAYELADELQELDAKLHLIVLFKSAEMLRQQADRISVLEANYKIQVNIVEKQQDYIDQLEQGLRASIELNKAQAERQTKPLSDEKIHELANEHLRTQNQDGRLIVLGLEDFARAIEERHGIK